MKITDEEIEISVPMGRGWEWQEGARWVRDRYELDTPHPKYGEYPLTPDDVMTKDERHEKYTWGDLIKALKSVGVDPTQAKLNDLKSLVFQHPEESTLAGVIVRHTNWIETSPNTLTHDERLPEGKENLTDLTAQQLLKKVFSDEPMTSEETMDAVRRTGYQRRLDIAKTEIGEDQNSHLRETALKMSRELNPNIIGAQGLGQYGSISTPPSIDKLLTDAEKIYEWLIKG